MDTARRIKKPLIHQVGSAVSLCRFYSHWLRTLEVSAIGARKSSGRARFSALPGTKTDRSTTEPSADRAFSVREQDRLFAGSSQASGRYRVIQEA